MSLMQTFSTPSICPLIGCAGGLCPRAPAWDGAADGVVRGHLPGLVLSGFGITWQSSVPSRFCSTLRLTCRWCILTGGERSLWLTCNWLLGWGTAHRGSLVHRGPAFSVDLAQVESLETLPFGAHD